MNMDTRLTQSMSMQLTFSQKLSLEILQLGIQELEMRIAEELEANPMLELKQPTQDQQSQDSDSNDGSDTTIVSEDIQVENDNREQIEEFFNPYLSESDYVGGGQQEDEDNDQFATLSKSRVDFSTDMHDQIEFLDPPNWLKPMIEAIIAQLDDRGYLTIEPDQIELDIPITPPPTVAEWQRALRFVQEQLNPAGLGAKDLQECLAIQIYRLGKEFKFELHIVETHLDKLLKNQLQWIAETENVPVQKIAEVLEFIKTLDPKPKAQFLDGDTQYLRPDAIVKYDSPDLFHPQGKFKISLANQENLELEVVPGTHYRHEGMSKQDRQYITNNTNMAKALVEAVRRRNQTLFLVIQSICQRQLKFFEEGKKSLIPLQMQEIAKDLDMSAATITRTVKDKAIQTDFGTFPLKYFFSLKKVKMASGEINEREDILNALKDIIESENKKKPLSDAAISKALQAKDFKVAVRTVSKYRDILDIPSSSKRKQF